MADGVDDSLVQVGFLFQLVVNEPGIETGILGNHDARHTGLRGTSDSLEHLPELFGDEWDEGMHEPQGSLQDRECCPLSGVLCSRICSVESSLDQFQVPVAVLVPHKLIDRFGGGVEFILTHTLDRRLDRVLEP